MMKSKKRFSLLLTLVFCLSLFPAAALPARAAEEISTWASLVKQLNLSGEYILTSDVVFRTGGTFETRDAEVPAGKEVVIDLRGHTIDRTDPEGSSQGSVITVKGKLTITNSSGNGVITGGNAAFGAGINVQPGGELILSGGFISGNTSTWEGGGVYLASGAALTMSGGYIYNNSAVECGGGVYLDADSSLSMTGGSIFRNTAVDGGGGVYLAPGSSFNMSGGSVDNNTGGGVQDDGGSISLAGYPYISSNTDFDGRALNLCLKEGNVVNAAELSGGSVGVTAPWAFSPRAFTAGLKSSGLALSFESDVPAYMVTTTGSGQATQAGALLVGSVEVTAANSADVLGDGKVSYDSDTNTLTLNGAAVTAPAGGTDACGIHYRKRSSELTICVMGTNTVTAGAAEGVSAGIAADGPLVIGGTGSLTASGGSGTGSRGISAGPLVIQGGADVTASGGNAVQTSFGVEAVSVLVRENASLSAAGGQSNGQSFGIHAGSGIVPEDNANITARTLSTAGTAGAISAGSSFSGSWTALGSESPDGSGAAPYVTSAWESYKWLLVRPLGPWISASVSGSRLSYSISDAPPGLLLIAARYNGGKLTALRLLPEPDGTGTVTLGGAGTEFSLFLLNSADLSPFCPPWDSLSGTH